MVKDCSDGAATPHNLKPRVTKNKLTDKDKMISSNNNIYEHKCYLTLSEIVADGMHSRHRLAMRINDNGSVWL